MRKRKLISLITGLALFGCSSAFATDALPNVPKNNLTKMKSIEKALEAMQKGLDKSFKITAENTQEKVCKDNSTDNKTTKPAAKEYPPAAPLKRISTKKTVQSIKRKEQKSVQPVKRKIQVKETVLYRLSQTQHTATLFYEGNIQYHIFTLEKRHTIAIDIFNPKRVFCYKDVCRIPVLKGSVFKKILAAKHYTKKDLKIYGKPFFRIAFILDPDTELKYKVSKENGRLSLVFLPSKTEPNTQHLRPITQNQKHYSTATPKDTPILSSKKAYTIHTSLKNISAIVSPYPIKKVLYSKEDGIQVQVIGKTVFIKPLPTRALMPDGTYRLSYPNGEKDIYIITDKKTYSLNLIPKDTPSVTYYLAPKQEPVILPPAKQSNTLKTERQFFKTAPKDAPDITLDTDSYSSYLLSLIKSVFFHKVPEGYQLQPYKRVFDYVQISVKGKYLVTNSQYTVYVYDITAKQDVYLDDRQFVSLVDNPLAVDIIKPDLKRGEKTELYIVVGGKQ